MIRTVLTATALMSATLTVSAPAFAQAPAAAAAPAAAFSTASTPLGDLLDNASAKAVLQKLIPDLIANPQIEMARGMTLKQLQSYGGGELSDEKLASIDAELAKIQIK